MERALLIGGRSFVGRHLSVNLRHRGIDVVATARKAPTDGSLISVDLGRKKAVKQLIREVQPSYVFNCAGLTTYPTPPARYFEAHVIGTLNLITAVRESSPSARVIVFGSAAEYGAVPEGCLPVSEVQKAVPLTFFAMSKLVQTDLMRRAALEWNLAIAILRPFNILGPGLGPQYLAGRLLDRIRSEPDGQELLIQNGNETRDFIDVRDVCEAAVRVASQTQPGKPEIYNVATGVETSVFSLAQELCRIAGGRIVKEAGVTQGRAGSISRSFGSAAKLVQSTGWTPGYSWKQSLLDMWCSSH